MNHLKSFILSAALAVATFTSTHAQTSLSQGNLLLTQVSGNVNTAGPVSILELNQSGGVVQTLTIPSGNGGLQISGTATSEGALTLNASGDSWTLAGYSPPYTGSGSLSSRTGAQAQRGFLTLGASGGISSTTLLATNVYSGQNIRAGVQSGSGIWFAGSSSGTAGIVPGVVYSDGTTSTSIQNLNSRNLGIYRSNLYVSSGSGTQGIYVYSGLPTTTATASAFLTGVTGQGTNPYDFEFSPDGNTLYVADSSIGVQKFTFNGTAWSLAYNLTATGITANAGFGLAVDWTSTGGNTVFWTTPTNVYKALDGGTAVTGTSISSISSTTGAYRGLDIVTIPEPSSAALLGFGTLALLGLRRLNRKS